jgi:hypothetical protein
MSIRSARYLCTLTCLLPLGACSGAPEQTSEGADEAPSAAPGATDPDIGAVGEELTGVVNTSGCTANEQQSAQLAVEAGRFVAVSTGFAECLALAMGTTVTLLHKGASKTAGPYVPQSGDPFAQSDLNTQFSNVLYAAQSTDNVSITCGGSADVDTNANAAIGSWSADRDSPEAINAMSGWGGFAAMDNHANGTTAEFYQFARREIAGTIWHEAMHQWGYRHPGGTTLLPAFFQTLPYIVGDCMETVMARSSQCTLDCNTAATGRRPVMRSGDTTCECVDDPQFDVGIMLDPGQSCPGVAGRLFFPQTELYLDNEDTNNKNSRGGWIGQNVSDSNTRFRLCTLPGKNFKQLRVSTLDNDAPKNYAVVRAGASCPPGAAAMNRYFDDEDSNNNDSSVGHVGPHESGSNTRLQLCLFRETLSSSNSSTAPFPDLGVRYGVFAPGNFPGLLATGFIRTDDEDSGNNDSVGGSFAGSKVFLDTSGANTLLSLARVR